MILINKNQKGFSVVILLLSIVALGLAAFDGWLVYDKYIKEDTSTSNSVKETSSKQDEKVTSKSEVRNEYKFVNEGLSFSYNPKVTNVTLVESKYYDYNDIFFEDVEIVTGKATVTVKAGVDGIGGGPGCVAENRNECTVVGTRSGKFLGDTITYRLIKAETVTNCGSDSLPSCDTAPLDTKFLIDTSTSTDEYAPCCAMINYTAKNTAKKGGYTGAVLINMQPDSSIKNADLLKHPDIVESIKIIESMKY